MCKNLLAIIYFIYDALYREIFSAVWERGSEETWICNAFCWLKFLQDYFRSQEFVQRKEWESEEEGVGGGGAEADVESPFFLEALPNFSLRLCISSLFECSQTHTPLYTFGETALSFSLHRTSNPNPLPRSSLTSRTNNLRERGFFVVNVD